MFKRSMILPALAILALAACGDDNANQTSSTNTTTTTASEIAPATGDITMTPPEAVTTAPNGVTGTTIAPSTTDSMGNAGPAAGMSASEMPAAPNPETFNEQTAADTMEDDATCGDHSAWVGQPVDEVALTETGNVYRVMKAGDPMTMDHNPGRINVEHEDGNVTRVWCG